MSCNIIYCINCTSCQIRYVGCTARRKKTRIREHVYGAVNSDAKNISNVSKHFCDIHTGNVFTLKVVGIERVSNPLRGGDKKRAIK